MAPSLARLRAFCFPGGRLGFIAVTDAYEKGHGRLVVKLGGLVPVKKAQGPEYDKGELQRYLGAIVTCPPILLNHASLECTAVAPLTLRLRDREDPTGATIDLDLGEDGRPLGCRADRPREAGTEITPTPWAATCAEFQEQEGIRLPTRLEIFWSLPEDPFCYFRGEMTGFTIGRPRTESHAECRSSEGCVGEP